MAERMENNDMMAFVVGGLVDAQGTPVAGASVSGWDAVFGDESDASAAVELVQGQTIDYSQDPPAVVAGGPGDCLAKGKDVNGTVIIRAHTVNSQGQPGGDQTVTLEIGEPNVAAGGIGVAGPPIARI